MSDDRLVMPNALEMTDRWQTSFGDCRPISYELRGWFPDRWVRFHSLPESQRYASTEAEYGEILTRERLTLGELLAGDASANESSGFLLISSSWSRTAEPAPRISELSSVLPAGYWTSLLRDSDAEDSVWVHLWTSVSKLDDPNLDDVLRLVADDAAQLIALPYSFAWLYAPYDGGADIIARSTAERDLLKSQHESWLSTHPLGL